MDVKEAVIIDNGSSTCRAGLAGDDAPKSVFPSVIGKTRNNETKPGSDPNDCFVGDKAQEKRGVLTLSYPIKKGIVTDWEAMETLWQHVFTEELNLKPEEHNVLVTEPPFNPNINREKMTEVMFEKFQVPAFYVAIPAHLAVYANGRVSSIVYDCGEEVSHVVLVYEGHTMPYATQRSNIAGSDVTSHFARLLGERGHTFSTTSEMEIAREIKEKIAYVAVDFENEMSKPLTECETTYTLPDGKEMRVGNERFRSAECLFDPSIIGMEGPGAHELINKCLQQCDIDTRKDLFCNILMSGGTTLCPGFSDRMKREMRKFIPENTRFNVISPPERRYSVWIGGSILTSLSVFQNMWITKQHYEEEGSKVVHRKCLRFQEAK